MISRLAWRSIWRHRRRTLITVSSIALGLTFVLFFFSLGEGVYNQLINDAVRMQAGHITIEHPDYGEAPATDLAVDQAPKLRARIGALARVERAKLLVVGQGIARSGSGAVGVTVMGVEPSVEAATSPLARRLVEGDYLDDDDGAWIMVGSQLAEQLNLAPGKKVVLATNDVGGDLVEALFRVKGVFETGAEEVDGYLVQAPLAQIQSLYGLRADQVTQIGVVLHDGDDEQIMLTKLRQMLARRPVAVLPWQEVLPELSAFIRLDRVSDRTYQGMLIALILFTIFNTALMSVLEREHETAVLLALGTSPGQIRAQVLLESVFIGLLGCTLGVAIGSAISGVVQVYGWDLSSLYEEGMTVSGFAMSTRVHAKLTFELVAWVAGLVFTATVLISLIPMRRATRIEIVETMR